MEKETLERIAIRSWRTAASRFEASRRMQRCQNASTVCVAMLSLEIIVINLLVFIHSLHFREDVITVTTVCLSAFALALSLIISQFKYDTKAIEYHRCGVELANLEKRIMIYISSGKPESYKVMKRYNRQYDSIIKNSNLNHSTIDYDWAMIRSKKSKGEGLSSFYECRKWVWTYIKWHFLLTDSVYNLITFVGACAIILVIISCQV